MVVLPILAVQSRMIAVGQSEEKSSSQAIIGSKRGRQNSLLIVTAVVLEVKAGLIVVRTDWTLETVPPLRAVAGVGFTLIVVQIIAIGVEILIQIQSKPTTML
jgi:hypothetical protein